LGCLHVFLVVLMAVPLAFPSDVFFHIHALGLGRSTAGSWPPCAFPLPPVGGPLAVPGRAYRWHVSCWCVRLRWGSSARVSGHDSSAIQSLMFLLRRRRPVFFLCLAVVSSAPPATWCRLRGERRFSGVSSLVAAGLADRR
jgi:hypothetical protein